MVVVLPPGYILRRGTIWKKQEKGHHESIIRTKAAVQDVARMVVALDTSEAVTRCDEDVVIAEDEDPVAASLEVVEAVTSNITNTTRINTRNRHLRLCHLNSSRHCPNLFTIHRLYLSHQC